MLLCKDKMAGSCLQVDTWPEGAGVAPSCFISAAACACHPGSVPPVSTARGAARLHPSPQEVLGKPRPLSSGAPLPLPPHPFESSISFPDLPRVTDRNGRISARCPRGGRAGSQALFCLQTRRRRRPPAPCICHGEEAAAAASGGFRGGPPFPRTLSEHLSALGRSRRP